MKCENCNGQGEVREMNFDKEIGGPLYDIVTCQFCNGTGEVLICKHSWIDFNNDGKEICRFCGLIRE